MDVFEYIHIDCIREYILRRVREYVDVFANTYRHSYANCIVMSTYSRIIQCRTYSRIIQRRMRIRRHCIRVLRCSRAYNLRRNVDSVYRIREYNVVHEYNVDVFACYVVLFANTSYILYCIHIDQCRMYSRKHSRSM